jgi:phenylpyruvate tautomerase PptA (4-oxalocrotonate tautomerase family)
VPIVTVHLLDGRHPPERLAGMLAALTERYAAVLESPVGRIRAAVVPHAPEHWATGGEIGLEAPWFTALVLADRPADQRARLLAALTDVLVAQLDCERSLVRGQIVPVDAADWGIGGVPAAAARRAEIDARAGSRVEPTREGR